ncbi:MAG: hypothetical protein M1309_04015 [Actinobacteria bacterium]|nr:hypothetical protein [Actinomycetota bacterium]
MVDSKKRQSNQRFILSLNVTELLSTKPLKVSETGHAEPAAVVNNVFEPDPPAWLQSLP